MCPYRVDFFDEGEVEGVSRICCLPGMACAACRIHVIRVGGFGYQADMGLVDLAFIVEAAMARNAGKGVDRVELDFAMTAYAARCFGCGCYRLGNGRFLRFSRCCLLGTTTA